MIKLDHLTIAVRDYRRSRDWYRQVLGLEIEFEIPERRVAAMRDEFDFTIFLAGDATAAPPSCLLTFQVEDVERVHRRLSDAGIPFVHGPQKVFWGYGAELEDPDGYRIRLWDQRTMRDKGGDN
jgi:catechol 2,3-dioxygenase-like lactoylglutathione lyase family enzyme